MEKRIKRLATAQPFLSSKGILNELGVSNISYKTIQRRCSEAGLLSRRPAKTPLISEKNRRARLEFARKYLNCDRAFWKKILFSDETKINLFGSDGKRWVRRPEGKRYDPKYSLPTVKHGGGSVFLWGSFSGYGMGPIYFIEGKMDKFMYLDILKNIMEPYTEGNLPISWVFQHDNDPKHKAAVVSKWLDEKKIKVLDWPAQSPDLNPIENLWNELKIKLREKNYKNKEDLSQAIQQVWQEIDMTRVNKLIDSMPRRCQEVLRNNGYATHY